MNYLRVMVAMVVVVGLGVHAGDSMEDGSFEQNERGFCYCQQPYNRRGGSCSANLGTAILTRGCPNTNSFLQCSGQICSVQQCPASQVWNKLLNTCAPCATGMKVSTDLQVCVCNTGTTLSRTTGLCGPCPAGATIEVDRCYCPLNLALDRVNNACRVCPPGTTLTREGQCKCAFTSPQLYFSATTWSCQPCPGVVSTAFKGRGRISETCTCTGVSQIFDRNTVSCYTCPPNTTPDRDGDECRCGLNLQKFDMVSQTCQCARGYVLSAAANACIWNGASLNP